MISSSSYFRLKSILNNNYNQIIFCFEEFEAECEYLLTETQQELQEQFIQYGYDLQFIDYNLNLNYDPCKDPYCFASLLKEIEDCSANSEAVFFIVVICGLIKKDFSLILLFLNRR